jgi:Ser/Thr protein kinase RdoA (MazF antagonist)
MNRHWLVTPHSGEPFVLGCHHPARSTEAIEWAQQLVRELADRGWPVPLPCAPRGQALVSCDGFRWSAARYLPGASHESDDAQEFLQRGRVLARLNREMATLPARAQPPGAGGVADLDAYVRSMCSTGLSALLERVARADQRLSDLFRRERERNLRELEQLGYSKLAWQPIHGDFGRWNLLWTEGELTGLVDFDQSRLDAPVVDLADLLVPFMPLRPDQAEALFRGYEEVLALDHAERRLVPVLARATLLRWVAFLLASWHIEGGGELPGGVRRTLAVRLPAFDAAEPELSAAIASGRRASSMRVQARVSVRRPNPRAEPHEDRRRPDAEPNR